MSSSANRLVAAFAIAESGLRERLERAFASVGAEIRAEGGADLDLLVIAAPDLPGERAHLASGAKRPQYIAVVDVAEPKEVHRCVAYGARDVLVATAPERELEARAAVIVACAMAARDDSPIAAHPVHELERAVTASDVQLERLRALHEITSNPHRSLEDRIRDVLALGCRLLGMDVGLVTELDPTTTETWRVRTCHPDGSLPESVPLEAKQYDASLAAGTVLAITDLDEIGEANHPARQLGVRRFLGVPVRVHGAPYGSIQFVARSPGPIPEQDATFVAMLGKWAGHILERIDDEERRERLEENLRAAERRESLGYLAGALAHDFNNVLGGVLANATIALHALDDTGAVRESLEQIVGAAERAKELTSQMLAYAGAGACELVPVELSGLLGTMERDLRAVVPARIELDVGSVSRVWVEADRQLLRTAVDNVIANAVQAIGERRGRISIRIVREDHPAAAPDATFVARDAPTGAYAAIEIHDDGEGIAPEVLRHVFDPFFTTRRGGRGLGLPVVLGIALRHRGAVDISSDVGRGTSVRLLVPEGRGASTKFDSQAGPANARRVMVVDDDPIVRRGIARALARVGYDVLQCEDGLVAVEAFEAGEKVDIVVLDLTMPRLDGVATLDRIRAIHPALPVVVASGFAPPEITRRLSSDPYGAFVAKPFQPAVLLAALDSLIDPDA